MTTVLPLVITAVLLLVPIVLIIGLWRHRPVGKIDWLVTALSTGAFVGYVVLAGRWDLSSYYLRPLIVVAFVAALVVSLVRVRRAPWWSAPTGTRGWIGFAANALVAVAFLALFGVTLAGTVPGGTPAVALSPPLRDGVSYVGQGGASTWLNYHHANRAQAFAVDIVGLNRAGRNAGSFGPNDPAGYEIWGRPVHAPCTGTVIEARNDLADLRPPATDTENLAGNHVVIRCSGTDQEVDVTLAHLQAGSLTLKASAAVSEGQVIGRVGNTGNTSEPHLHVHAIRTGSGDPLRGDGVPIRFDGRFLLRNDLIVGG